jgi:hypothetical protein
MSKYSDKLDEMAKAAFVLIQAIARGKATGCTGIDSHADRIQELWTEAKELRRADAIAAGCDPDTGELLMPGDDIPEGMEWHTDRRTGEMTLRPKSTKQQGGTRRAGKPARRKAA